MSDSAAYPYTRSCNPPRRAKRLHTTPIDIDGSDDEGHSPPSPASTESLGYVAPDEVPTPPAPRVPAKRGRKPSTMSRSAREAQRKLNHSIIEKARRTKINGALATLRELVPQEYKLVAAEEDEEETADEDELPDGDGEYRDSAPGPSAKQGQGQKKARGKQPKEYKLDILVRAVAYMQDLVAKVEHLEGQSQAMVVDDTRSPDKKRKRAVSDVDHEHDEEDGNRLGRKHSLPSFSSLFASTSIDKEPRSHLPSPPSSTQFLPVRTPQLPPILTLDIEASPMVRHPSTSSVTPEDERAASLLLGISNSPPLPFPLKISGGTVPSYELPGPQLPRQMIITDAVARTTNSAPQVKPHTPSSFLGMGRYHKD